jgi:hypothetical protein
MDTDARGLVCGLCPRAPRYQESLPIPCTERDALRSACRSRPLGRKPQQSTSPASPNPEREAVRLRDSHDFINSHPSLSVRVLVVERYPDCLAPVAPSHELKRSSRDADREDVPVLHLQPVRRAPRCPQTPRRPQTEWQYLDERHGQGVPVSWPVDGGSVSRP